MVRSGAGRQGTDKESELQRLGAGGSRDRLHFRLVLQIFVRCFPFLRAVRVHLITLCLSLAALALVLLPIGALLFDTLWTRVLQGETLISVEAWFFRLDPAVVVNVEGLSADVRRTVAERVIWVGVAVGAVVAPAVIGLLYYQIWILQRINQILRVQLLDRLQALSLRFHAETRVGDAIYRLYQDSAMVTQLIDVLILTPVFAITRFVFGMGIVLLFAPKMALVLLAIWPPLILITAWFSRPLRVGFRSAREANSALTARIQETVAGIRVIKAYGAEGREQERFDADSRHAFSTAFSARSRFAVFGVSLFWIVGFAMLGTAALGAIETRQAAKLMVGVAGFEIWTLGLYSFFKQRFGDASRSARSLFRTWGIAQDIAIGLDRVFEILDLEPEIQDAPGAVDLAIVREGVRFRDVHFRYDPERPTLEGVDLTARLGTITAIVGPTGSGKSTLMALLLRLFDPDRGQVEIDGRSLRHFKVASVRHQVAIALQENLLFGATVRENIRYAVAGATDEEVWEAARVAGAAEFIAALPEGLDTPLGERGTKLSTGQRQRLSIARAVLKDPPILILDEPTASLDAETEFRVLENLAVWGKDRVIFLITHRLSSIRRADWIVVMQDGRVREQGPHAKLLTDDSGLYRRLVELEALPPAAPAEATLS